MSGTSEHLERRFKKTKQNKTNPKTLAFQTHTQTQDRGEKMRNRMHT